MVGHRGQKSAGGRNVRSCLCVAVATHSPSRGFQRSSDTPPLLRDRLCAFRLRGRRRRFVSERVIDQVPPVFERGPPLTHLACAFLLRRPFAHQSSALHARQTYSVFLAPPRSTLSVMTVTEWAGKVTVKVRPARTDKFLTETASGREKSFESRKDADVTNCISARGDGSTPFTVIFVARASRGSVFTALMKILWPSAVRLAVASR